ncbi:hypothetical protein [Paenibacillus apiarius]|uniref:hypothetical protein n=1 Tax=Paenibacillus apiarius TaxID=46240 RepID=UPI00197CBA8C|nr:hypothetical protein [Paenibacillus apiarius]MBN3526670.1 hypothetical protein [Paenibacillus apiarius]
MSCRPYCPPVEPVIGPTNTIVNNIFHPQLVPVIHPIEVVNCHHCVPIPRHIYTYTTREEVATISRFNKKKKRHA